MYTSTAGVQYGEGTFYLQLDGITDSEGNAVDTSIFQLGTASGTGSTVTEYDATGAATGTTINDAILVKYDPDNGGKLYSINGTTTQTTAVIDFTGAAGTQKFSDITIDLSSSKMQGNSGVMTAAMSKGDSDENGTGRLIGAMTGVTIDKYGKIYGTYDNGDNKLLGQIAVAEFANASGLAKEGENIYAATLNSGEFDGIGIDISANGGSMATGVLEMSNVDLSTEFTEMITTQRGFQANSRIITVSDTMIEELVNLKR